MSEPAAEILSAAKDLCSSDATELLLEVLPADRKNPQRTAADCSDGMSALGVFRLRQALRKRIAQSPLEMTIVNRG